MSSSTRPTNHCKQCSRSGPPRPTPKERAKASSCRSAPSSYTESARQEEEAERQEEEAELADSQVLVVLALHDRFTRPIVRLLDDEEVVLIRSVHGGWRGEPMQLDASGGRPVHTDCTLFKSGNTTEKQTSGFQSRKGGDGIRTFTLREIQRESVKLG
jgi:hypothetical protein